MLNFSLLDTEKYLKEINRMDVNAEGLYLELNKAILEMDLMRDEIVTAQRCSLQFNTAFQEDLIEIIKHTKKLCEILGVEESGVIKANYNGAKAQYAYTKTQNEKPNRKDNLYWGLSYPLSPR